MVICSYNENNKIRIALTLWPLGEGAVADKFLGRRLGIDNLSAMRNEQSPVLPFYVPLGNPPSSPRGQSPHYAYFPTIITGTSYHNYELRITHYITLISNYIVFIKIVNLSTALIGLETN